MNSNLTDLNILVDRSASMGPLTQAVRTGIKELIQNQKQRDGDCNITVAQFDRDPTSPAIWNPVVNKRNAFLPDGFGVERPNSAIVDYLCEGVPLDVVSDGVLDGYEPRGNTPLLEACRDFINRIGDRLRQTPEHLRPAKVIVVIQTDGEENSSIGVTQSQLKEMSSTRRAGTTGSSCSWGPTSTPSAPAWASASTWPPASSMRHPRRA